MKNPILPVMTVLAVVAGAVGLQLGETTVSQIDPLYFQGAAPSPRDVTRGAAQVPENSYVAASGWAEGYADRAADCGANCGPDFINDGLDRPLDGALMAYSDETIEPRWDEAGSESIADFAMEEEAAPPSRLQRYLDFPVSDEQRDIRAAIDPAREQGTPGI